METDVLIVGAGPAGLTLAIDLVRRKLRVLLLERLAGPMPGSKGKGLQPRTLEVFDDLGIAGEILAVAQPYPMLRFYAGARVAGERPFIERQQPTDDIPYPNTLMLPQARTEAILRDRLAALGGAIAYGTELVAFEDRGDEIHATLGDGRTVSARYLVGADGGRSAVRKLAGIALEGTSPDLPGAIVADLEVANLSRDAWHIWATSPADMIGLVPLPGTDQFQLTTTLIAGAEPDLSLAALQRVLDQKSGRTDLLLSNLGWASHYRPNVRMAERFRQGNVFLVGDAAHVHPPTGGQGLNTSVQDAYNLGWKLAAVLHGGPAGLLDSYEQERLPIAAAVLGLSESLLRRGYAGDEAALSRGADEQQLGLNYRDSPLSEGLPDGPLRPGDRMPDGVLPDGRRVFDVLRGGAFTILEWNGTTFVIRPDHYIGGIFASRAEANAYAARLSGR